MSSNATTQVDRLSVRGTTLLASDSREQYRQKIGRITLDSMVQFVGLLDAQGTVLEINQVALDAVGITLADVEGRPFWSTFWWQVSEAINQGLRDAIGRAACGEFVRWDTEIYGRAGGRETIVIDASLMPVKDETGAVVFIAAEGRDITEKKAYEREIARQREELARLDELKTQFFANISHEFRTPLTLLMGPLDDVIAQPDALKPMDRERLELAQRNAVRLLKLVNTLLDFARIEAGRLQASYEPTDLAALTADLAAVFRSAIERAGMALIIDCPPIGTPVHVDREMWEKIVLNLLSNAFKFTFEGSITVAMRQIGDAAVLSVADTGTGIPEGELASVFDRFHRVRGARGRSYEGSGIGLALVQELARLHGGTVQVESEVDRGSRFSVTIPIGVSHLPAERIRAERTLASTGLDGRAYVEEVLRWLPDATQPADALAAPAVTEGAETGLILLADDNADMREYVRRLLGQCGHAVEAVADGLDALRAVRQRRPDLVLTDVMMPGLDGFGLLRALQADPGLASIPVILLSARAGEEARIEGLRAGARDYLVKPFSARELQVRVQSVLAMARVRREADVAVRRSEERLRALVSASSTVVYRMSADWHEMLELEGQGLVADAEGPDAAWLARYVHPDDQAQLVAACRRAIAGRSMFELEHRVRRLDGTFGWTLSRAVPLFDADGRIVEWFGAASDITGRKRAESALRDLNETLERRVALESARRAKAEDALRQSQKMEAIGQLSGGIAHDFNNLLGAVGGCFELIARRMADGRSGAERYISAGQDAVRRAATLTQRLLAFSRQQTLDPKPTDANRLIAGMEELIRRTVGTNIAVEVVGTGGLWLTTVDAPQLESSLLNLCINARDAMAPVGGRLTVATDNRWLDERAARERDLAPGQYVAICVTDTGTGMKPEVVARAFDPFFTTKPIGQGTGLGLSMVYGFVRQSGGQVRIYSEEAKGTTVCLYLPRFIGTLEERAAAEAPSAVETGDGETVLVVDDEPALRMLIGDVLEENGYHVLAAADGAAALSLLGSDLRIDLLITDVGLPGGMNGHQVADLARASRPDLKVLYVTGFAEIAVSGHAHIEPGMDVLTKPFEITGLAAKVREILER